MRERKRCQENIKTDANKYTESMEKRCWIYARQMMLKSMEKEPRLKPKGIQQMTNSMQTSMEKTMQKHMSKIWEIAKTWRAWLPNPPSPSSFLATLAAFAPTEALDCSSLASVIWNLNMSSSLNNIYSWSRTHLGCAHCWVVAHFLRLLRTLLGASAALGRA